MTFDLSAALEALRGRMQTNPSEFFSGSYKWNFISREGLKEILTEDELKLLTEGLVYVSRAELSNSIMHSLLDEPERTQGYDAVTYGPVTTSRQDAMQQMEIARQQNQQQYGSALGQNTPSQYMKSFFK